VSERAVVRVAAAVLVRGDGRVLLARRMQGTPYAGYWEFPGGKLEAGESPRDALTRELHEELGIRIAAASPWLTREYVYPHAHVELSFFRVFAWEGALHGREGQAVAWQTPGAFDVAPLLPANAAVLRALDLPQVYAISIAEDIGETAFLARARVAIDRGLRLIQLREKSLPAQRLESLAHDLSAIAQPRGARIVLNGSTEVARRLGCAGVHWPTATLLAARERPVDLLCGASCHNADELAHACRLDVDFVVLGPVLPTPLHQGEFGWDGFARLVRGTSCPVYALGGLELSDLDHAIALGAHGVALRRGAWQV
jgi:8-oxo-dGTP diphosphatase